MSTEENRIERSKKQMERAKKVNKFKSHHLAEQIVSIRVFFCVCGTASCFRFMHRR